MSYTVTREYVPALAIQRITLKRRGATAEVLTGSRAAIASSLERMYRWDDPIVVALRRGRDAAAYLMWIQVKHKSRGTGSELLAATVELLREEGVRDLYAHSIPDSAKDLPRLLRFYARNEFSTLGYHAVVRRL